MHNWSPHKGGGRSYQQQGVQFFGTYRNERLVLPLGVRMKPQIFSTLFGLLPPFPWPFLNCGQRPQLFIALLRPDQLFAAFLPFSRLLSSRPTSSQPVSTLLASSPLLPAMLTLLNFLHLFQPLLRLSQLLLLVRNFLHLFLPFLALFKPVSILQLFPPLLDSSRLLLYQLFFSTLLFNSSSQLFSPALTSSQLLPPLLNPYQLFSIRPRFTRSKFVCCKKKQLQNRASASAPTKKSKISRNLPKKLSMKIDWCRKFQKLGLGLGADI